MAFFLFSLVIILAAIMVTHAQNCVDHMTGKSVDDGATFTREFTGPCITYICNLGSISPFIIECKDGESVCHPIGHQKSYFKGCIEQECMNNDKGVGYQTIKEGCENNGACVNVDDNVKTDTCETKACKKTADGIGFVFTALECQDAKGDCFPAGETFSYKNAEGTVKDGCTCEVNMTAINRNYVCNS